MRSHCGFVNFREIGFFHFPSVSSQAIKYFSLDCFIAWRNNPRFV